MIAERRVRACFLVVGLVACGGRFDAGLANAPSIERKTETRREHDSISNGPEGCSTRDGGPSLAGISGGCEKGSN